MTDRYLTTRTVADWLGVSTETVLRWHRNDKLPGGCRLNGSNCLRFRESIVEAWLEERSLEREDRRRLPSTGEAASAGPDVFESASVLPFGADGCRPGLGPVREGA